MIKRAWLSLLAVLVLYSAAVAVPVERAAALDTIYQPLPFAQNWSNPDSITVDHHWSGIPGISGYSGEELTSTTGADPQALLAEDRTVSLLANRSNPNALSTGGVVEFALPDPVVALQGSGSADAPGLVLYLNTRGWRNITISYRLRDIDGSGDHAVQPVAIQYRIGSSSSYTNLPEGFVADATTGPNLSEVVTNVQLTLPQAAANREQVEVRILTANAVGNDEWVGVDDIQVWGTALDSCDTRIHAVQGAAHRSPLEGQVVTVCGVVTARRNSGFFLQEIQPDALPETSEGIYVYTGEAWFLAPGDSAMVTGTVVEYRPGGGSSPSLTLTEIQPSRVTYLSTGSLPAPVVIGAGGRVPPVQVIDNDTSGGNAETPGQSIFDPAEDGLDFYESLEGMRVQVNNAVAASSTERDGLTAVIGDHGALAGVGLRSSLGGMVVRAADFNPERILLEDAIIGAANLPDAQMGQQFTTPLVGVLESSGDLFRLLLTDTPVTLAPLERAPDAAHDLPSYGLRVASYNIHNLAPGDLRYPLLAAQIIQSLRAPDLLVLQEIQDQDGSANTGTISAEATIEELIAAITAAGGPLYDYRQIDPENNRDGGEPGSNIRVVFLFRTDRVAAAAGTAGDAVTAVHPYAGPDGVHLSANPGRIDPRNAAFVDSRKPLAGAFWFTASTPPQQVFVIGSHFTSRSNDDPLFGRFQPPVLRSEAKRIQQAQSVHAFVQEILALDPQAQVIVLGDLNDFPFSPVLTALRGPGTLFNLAELLGESERFSYVFEGNSQQLDHILVSAALLPRSRFQIVHSNTPLPEAHASRASDHDPVVAWFDYSIPLYLPAVYR